MPDGYRVRLTRQAIDDIDDIREFIGQTSPHHAAVMIERLFDAFDSLEAFPHRTVIQVAGDRLSYPVRSLPVRPYIIYFGVIESEQAVVIRHIRHGARRRPETFE